MANLDTKAALPDDIAVALDHGAITERDAADEMAKRLRAAIAEVERLEFAATNAAESADALADRLGDERHESAGDARQLSDRLAAIVDGRARVTTELHAEIRRLRAEVTEADAATESIREALQSSVDSFNDERAEVERLRADVRQFERAASEILDDAQWFDEHYDDGDEASDLAHRIIQRVLGLFVGRELPGPWAFDKLLDERNELRGDVERLTGERDKAMLLVSGGAAEFERAEAAMAALAFARRERDKALADRAVLVEAIGNMYEFAPARVEVALRAVGEEP